MAGEYGLLLSTRPDLKISNFGQPFMCLILLVILFFPKFSKQIRIGMLVARSLLLLIGMDRPEIVQ